MGRVGTALPTPAGAQKRRPGLTRGITAAPAPTPVRILLPAH